MKSFLLLGAALCVLPFYAGASTVRPAVGKPLQQAETLISRQDYHAALQKVQQAKAVAGLTSYESLMIAQVQGAAAAGAGDYPAAATAYQAVLASGTASAAEKITLTQAIAGLYYQAQDYPHAAAWTTRYIDAGGSDPHARILLAQSYYQAGDFAHAEQAAWRDVKAATPGGAAPPEGELQLLASSAEKSADQQGYRTALELLLKAYPAPAYWAQAIALVTASPDFADGLTLSVYRLRLATGTLSAPADYEDYTERAILAGQPAEAKRVINQGFSTGILSAATDSGHAERLRTLAAAKAQGASIVLAAQPQGDPLAAGIVAFNAGQKTQAVQLFQTVPSYNDPDGSAAAQLARLWAIRASLPGGN